MGVDTVFGSIFSGLGPSFLCVVAKGADRGKAGMVWETPPERAPGPRCAMRCADGQPPSGVESPGACGGPAPSSARDLCIGACSRKAVARAGSGAPGGS